MPLRRRYSAGCWYLSVSYSCSWHRGHTQAKAGAGGWPVVSSTCSSVSWWCAASSSPRPSSPISLLSSSCSGASAHCARQSSRAHVSTGGCSSSTASCSFSSVSSSSRPGGYRIWPWPHSSPRSHSSTGDSRSQCSHTIWSPNAKGIHTCLTYTPARKDRGFLCLRYAPASCIRVEWAL